MCNRGKSKLKNCPEQLSQISHKDLCQSFISGNDRKSFPSHGFICTLCGSVVRQKWPSVCTAWFEMLSSAKYPSIFLPGCLYRVAKYTYPGCSVPTRRIKRCPYRRVKTTAHDDDMTWSTYKDRRRKWQRFLQVQVMPSCVS